MSTCTVPPGSSPVSRPRPVLASYARAHASARVGPTRVARVARVARVGAGALNVREALDRAGVDRSVAIHEAGHIWMLQGGRTDLAAIDLGATSDFAMLEADADRPGALDSTTAEERAIDLLEDDWDEVIGLADHLQDHGGDLGGWLSTAVRR